MDTPKKQQSWLSRLLFGSKRPPQSLAKALPATQSQPRETKLLPRPAQTQGQTRQATTTGVANQAKTGGDLRGARTILVLLGHDPERMIASYAHLAEAYICAPSAADLQAVIGDRPSATLRGDHTCKWIIVFSFYIPGRLGVRSTETQMRTFAQSFGEVFRNHRDGRFRSLDSTFAVDVATSEIGLLINSTARAETAYSCCECLEYAFGKLGGATD